MTKEEGRRAGEVFHVKHLLSDAEGCEEAVEDLLDVDASRDLADGPEGEAGIFGRQLSLSIAERPAGAL